jgi:hypothetical protein
MSVLDFLFEGKPPQSVTTYGTKTDTIPQWMSDYTQGVIGKANAVAAEPYQAYGGPRVASFTPDQQAAFEATRNNQGIANPFINEAAAGNRQASAVNPLAAASPYLSKAGGSWTDPGVADSYMNPYIQNVLNRNQTLAQRNLTENFIPGLQDAFTSGGSFGGTRMEEMGLRGTRDIAENLNEQNLASLAGAYGQGANIYGADASRAGNVGTAVANASGMGADIGFKGAQQSGALGELAQSTGLKDTAALETIGGEQQGLGQKSLDTAYKDFTQQRDYPRDTIGWMNSVVKGMPYSKISNVSETGPSQTYQPSPLSQLASAGSAIYGINQMRQKRGGLIRGGYAR